MSMTIFQFTDFSLWVELVHSSIMLKYFILLIHQFSNLKSLYLFIYSNFSLSLAMFSLTTIYIFFAASLNSLSGSWGLFGLLWTTKYKFVSPVSLPLCYSLRVTKIVTSQFSKFGLSEDKTLSNLEVQKFYQPLKPSWEFNTSIFLQSPIGV